MFSVPALEFPMYSGVLIQVEPAPSTLTVPEPSPNPTKPRLLLTHPPPVTFSVPCPSTPTNNCRFVHVEPAPSTVTVPIEPDWLPIEPTPLVLVTCPPAVTLS